MSSGPDPSNLPTLDCGSPVRHESKSAGAGSLRLKGPEQSTTGNCLRAELTRLKGVLKKEQTRLVALPQVQSLVGKLGDHIDYLPIKEEDPEYETLIFDMINLAPLLWKPFIESNPRNIPQIILDIVASIEKQFEEIKEAQSHPRANSPPMAAAEKAPDQDEERPGKDKGRQQKEEERKKKKQEERLKNVAEKSILKHFREVGEQFRKLQDEISSWGEKREQWTDARLKDLLPTHEAYYDAALPITVTKRAGCTKNTRVGLLNDTQAWTRDPDGAKIFWLNGMAGTGKTTIAYSMCKWLQHDKRLGASFFCSRNSLECRDVNRIVPTIVYQLGQRGQYPDSYRHRLCTVFEEDADVAKRDISKQFENLILKPLSRIDRAVSNRVVVIDALDECTDMHGAEVVLNMLLQYAEDLPIKFFITGRPEPAIIQRMTAGDGAMRSIIWLHDIEKSLVQADIKTYFVEALQSIQVTPSELDALTQRAGCLFIFAATAVRYIIPNRGAVNHRQRLQTVLKIRPSQGNKSHKDIDDLYFTILSNALDDEMFEEEELALRRRVLWTVACMNEPLTTATIANLLSLPDTETVEVAVQPLQSVLRLSDTTNLVSTFHASFPDFLFNKKRAGQFHCSEGLQNAYLAECCFQIMERSLQFNICGLESSYMIDQDVSDLQERVDRVISAELFYACKYWSDHLSKAPLSQLLVDLLDSFLHHRLLFWIEVLNLAKYIDHGDGVLGRVLAWLLPEENLTDLQDFIQDARSFLNIFARHPISRSTPHIYISALPFTSKNSHVWKTYWPRTQGLIQVKSKETRRTLTLATWVVGDAVYSMAQSSDGKRIVSGSRSGWEVGPHLNRNQSHSLSQSGQVRIMDAFSGTCIIGPLAAHTGRILHVAFSPDDTRVASGAADQTICIWGASDGHLISGPLHGHTKKVNSVSFSRDGAYLASGSDDHTIRLWDAYSGTQLGDPIKGHQDGVTSIAFSPDGKHIASGSSDRSVRVWDFRTRKSTRGPFEGHIRAVFSIAYSPDALRLVSGSADQTIRVWDVASGRLLAEPFTGHTGTILSVSFSPNGSLVLSGSCDKTIRVWEAQSGTLMAGPFEGHNDRVNTVLFRANGSRFLSSSDDGTIREWDMRQWSTDTTKPWGHTGSIHAVAFSPDGTRAASCSFDRSICVWDTYNAALLAGPLKGHAGWVNSVSFSPDGSRIVSGSQDRTLRIWDVPTGTMLTGPFEGHTASVKSDRSNQC